MARLLKDERVEVREKAGKVLGGLLHCSFLSKEESSKLLDQFTKEISKKMRRKPKEGEDPAEFQTKQTKAILLRHAGVLGLSSFVVSFKKKQQSEYWSFTFIFNHIHLCMSSSSKYVL